jgi:hypothetical protein
MTVTATLLNATQYRLIYVIEHDGGGGDSVTLTNARLLADAAESNILQDMFNTPVADLAEATLLLQGAEPGVIRLYSTSDTLGIWAAEVEEDGSNRVRVVIDRTPGVVGAGRLEIARLHTYNQ